MQKPPARQPHPTLTQADKLDYFPGDTDKRIVEPGGSVILWQPYRRFRYLEKWFDDAKIIAVCNIRRGRRYWQPLIFWTKGKGRLRHHEPNDWIMGNQGSKAHDKFARLHPCVTAVADAREVIRRFTRGGIIDVFAGTGSILQAAKLEGRDYLGVEQSKKYAALAKKRLA